MSKYISSKNEVFNFFKNQYDQKLRLWCWQECDKSSKKIVHYAYVEKLHFENNKLYLKPNTKSGFKFSLNRPVYLLSTKDSIACSFMPLDLASQFIVSQFPEGLTTVENLSLNGTNLIEEDDEVNFYPFRKEERKKFDEGKLVGVRRIGSNDEVGILSFFELYDISAGGIGFLVNDPGEFLGEDKIVIESIDGDPLDKSYPVLVKSLRQINESQFKVGCHVV